MHTVRSIQQCNALCRLAQMYIGTHNTFATTLLSQHSYNLNRHVLRVETFTGAEPTVPGSDAIHLGAKPSSSREAQMRLLPEDRYQNTALHKVPGSPLLQQEVPKERLEAAQRAM